MDESRDTIEALLEEERRYPPPAAFAAQANAQPGIYERDGRPAVASKLRLE